MIESEENQSLTLILPSDSNLNVCPNNKPESFVIQLEKSIQFDRPMECALFDIILPNLVPYLKPLKFHLVYSLLSYDNSYEKWNFAEHILFTYQTNKIKYFDSESVVKEVIKTLSELPKIEEISEKLKKLGYLKDIDLSNCKFWNPNLYPRLDKIHYEKGYFINDFRNKNFLDGFMLYLKFDDKLFNFLGFDKKYKLNIIEDFYIDDKNIKHLGSSDDRLLKINYEQLHTKSGHISFFHIEGNLNFNIFEKSDYINKIDYFVSCDLIIDSYINNKKKQYLRYCHCDQTGNTTVKFEPLIYIPIIKNYFNKIEITLKDIGDDFVKFENGSAILILHIKAIE